MRRKGSCREHIDHRNQNGLDCRKGNLRLCSPAQNHYNSGPRDGAKSKYKGVSWRADCRKWKVHLSVAGEYKHVGSFDSEIEAAEAYNGAALEYHGEFAVLNEV